MEVGWRRGLGRAGYCSRGGVFWLTLPGKGIFESFFFWWGNLGRWDWGQHDIFLLHSCTLFPWNLNDHQILKQDSGFVYNERRSGKSSRSEGYQGVEAPGNIVPKTGSNPLGKHPQLTEKEENCDSNSPFFKFWKWQCGHFCFLALLLAK